MKVHLAHHFRLVELTWELTPPSAETAVRVQCATPNSPVTLCESLRLLQTSRQWKSGASCLNASVSQTFRCFQPDQKSLSTSPSHRPDEYKTAFESDVPVHSTDEHGFCSNCRMMPKAKSHRWIPMLQIMGPYTAWSAIKCSSHKPVGAVGVSIRAICDSARPRYLFGRKPSSPLPGTNYCLVRGTCVWPIHLIRRAIRRTGTFSLSHGSMAVN